MKIDTLIGNNINCLFRSCNNIDNEVIKKVKQIFFGKKTIKPIFLKPFTHENKYVKNLIKGELMLKQ